MTIMGMAAYRLYAEKPEKLHAAQDIPAVKRQRRLLVDAAALPIAEQRDDTDLQPASSTANDLPPSYNEALTGTQRTLRVDRVKRFRVAGRRSLTRATHSRGYSGLRMQDKPTATAVDASDSKSDDAAFTSITDRLQGLIAQGNAALSHYSLLEAFTAASNLSAVATSAEAAHDRDDDPATRTSISPLATEDTESVTGLFAMRARPVTPRAIINKSAIPLPVSPYARRYQHRDRESISSVP